MSCDARSLTFGFVSALLSVAAAGCTLDDLDHEGKCPEKVLPSGFEGTDLDVLRGYTRVGGDLVVPEGASDLSALRCLERVDGTLTIGGAAELQTLDGLENLEHVGGLSLSALATLSSTAGLASLREIDGALFMEGVPSLRTIEAPRDLEVLGGGVHLRELDSLERWEAPLGVDAIDSLQAIQIADGASIGAFAEIVEIPEGVVIEGPSEATVGLHLRLDALVSTPTLYLDAIAPETVESLGALSDVGTLRLLRYFGEDLVGMSSVRRIESLHVSTSPNLRSVAGLAGVEELTALDLAANPVLEDLDGLSGLRAMPFIALNRAGASPVYPHVRIHDCPALVDITGLASVPVTYLDRLHLVGVPSLASLGEWPALSALGGLELSGSGVENLDALSDLTTLDSLALDAQGQPLSTDSFSLILDGNPRLADLDGLDPARGGALSSVGWWGEIVIRDNPSLPTCAVDALAESLAALGRTDGGYEVSGNADTPCD